MSSAITAKISIFIYNFKLLAINAGFLIPVTLWLWLNLPRKLHQNRIYKIDFIHILLKPSQSSIGWLILTQLFTYYYI